MEKIPPDQLEKIVAEVEQLSKQKEKDLDRQEVKEILAALNLSPDLLDEAMIQLRRREALEVQKKRNWWIGVGVVFVLVFGITGTIILMQNYQQSLQAINVYQSRLTLPQDDGGNLQIITRKNSSEVFYRVTLQNAPIGEKLALNCQWIDPQGEIAHKNSYQTRQIDKEVWTTHCRYLIGNAAISGTWKVEMYLGNRILSNMNFKVK